MQTSRLSVSVMLVLACIGATVAYPATRDLFPGFLSNINLDVPNKERDVVKRRVYEENRDAGLKQISLQSLIGELEDSLYQSALSVSSVAGDKDSELPEITPATLDERNIGKRQTKEKTVGAIGGTTAEPPAEGKEILLQTTQKVPEKEGVPAHILIDRISVQPHNGGVPLIPAFEVHHTKVISATIKEPNANNAAGTDNTQILITKTEIEATGTDIAPAATNSTTEKAKNDVQLTSTNGKASTEAPIVQLKQAEEKLKEKVAEIEAEPVILTARV